MTVKTVVRASCICALMSIIAASVQAAAELPKRSRDGLELVEARRGDGVAILYVRPGTTLTAYKRIMLDPVEVAFDKSWKPRPAVSAQDRERIQRELAQEFRVIFADELETKGGYQIAETAAPDVLRVAAAIADLYIEMPGVGTSPWSKTYVVSASRMSLVSELRDSESGVILARVADRRTASSPGRMPGVLHWTTKESNRAEARRILRTWAEFLRTALDSAREEAAP
jgi:hypothetical protein